MTKVLSLCEIAALARDISIASARPDSMRRMVSVSQFGITREDFNAMLHCNDDEGTTSSKVKSSLPPSEQGDCILYPANQSRGALNISQKAKVNDLLGAWYVAFDSCSRYEYSMMYRI